MKRLIMMAAIGLAGLIACPALAQDGTTAPSLPQIKSADQSITSRALPVQCVNNAGKEVSCGANAGTPGSPAASTYSVQGVPNATPVTVSQAAMTAATSTALTGTSSGVQTVGPFTPVLGRPIIVTLAAASWPGGSVQVLRSRDGGTTKLPLTPAGITIGVYPGVGADSVWVETEAGAAFYLSLPGSGITYRVSQ